MPYTSALLQIITPDQYEGRQTLDTGQVTVETHNNIFAEQFETITDGVIVQPTSTNEKRSYIFESISGNTDDITVSLQNLDEEGIRWTFDTVKASILPEQARGNGKGLQGLSTVDDIRLIVNGSEFESAIIHGGRGDTGKGKGQGGSPTSQGQNGIVQIVRASSVTSNTGWTAVGGFDELDVIDDVDPDGDSTYISATASGSFFEIKLDPELFPPPNSLNHDISVHSRSVGGAQQPEQIDFSTLEGGVEVCAHEPFAVNRLAQYNVDVFTCLNAEANSISNYSDLSISMTVGNIGAGEEVRVTKIEFHMPKDDSTDPFGFFSYNGTHNIMDIRFAKQLDIKFTNATGALIRNLPLNATGLEETKNTLGDVFPNSYSIIQIETFLTSMESFSPSSIRVDLIRDDFIINQRSVPEVIFKMDGNGYGLDQALSSVARVMGDKYIQVANVNTFFNEIIDTVKADTEFDRIED